MDNGVLIVKACFRTGSLDREVMHNDICKQLENSNVVVLPLGWDVVYYPPGTEVVADKEEEARPKKKESDSSSWDNVTSDPFAGEGW